MKRWLLLVLVLLVVSSSLLLVFGLKTFSGNVSSLPGKIPPLATGPLEGKRGVRKKERRGRKPIGLKKERGGFPPFFDLLDINPFIQDGAVSGWHTFKVVMAETGRPCPGALVSWYPGHNLDRSSFRGYIQRLSGYEKILAVLSKGLHTRTDVTGVCRIPKSNLSVLVAARKGNALGFSSTPFSVLYLEKPVQFQIRVQNKKGIPLGGVPLLARGRDPVGNLRDIWNGMTTEKTGIAVVRIFPGRLGKRFGKNVQVLLAWPSPVARERWVSLDPPPQAPVVLEAPETGRIIVKAEWTEKLKSCGPFWAELSPDYGEGVPGRNDFTLWGQIEQGMVVFPNVGLGLRLRVLVKPFHKIFHNGTESSCGFWEGPGPVRAGETLIVKLDESVEKGFYFQAVDEEGIPIKGKRLLFEEIGGSNGVWQAIGMYYGKTDERGFYRALFNHRKWENWFRVSLWPPDGKRPGEGAPSALVRVPPVQGSNGTFLGNVVFRAPKTLLEGKVLDQNSHGVSGAYVRAAPVGEKFPPSGGSYWVYSGPEGHFRILGNASSDLLVRGYHQDYGWTKPLLFPPYKRNVQLRFKGCLEIQGLLFLDNPYLARSISIWAIEKSNGKAVKGRPFYRNGKDKKRRLAFQVTRVWPGTWDVSFYIGPWRVGSIGSVSVPSKISNVVVETLPMDLRGKVRSFSFRLLCEDKGVEGPFRARGSSSSGISLMGSGGRARKCFLLCFDPSGKVIRIQGFLSGKKGLWTFPFPAGLDPQALWVTGYTPHRITGKDGMGETLYLEKAIPVHLEIDGPVPLLGSSYFLQFGIKPAFRSRRKEGLGFEVFSSTIETFLHKGGKLVHKTHVPFCGDFEVFCNVKETFSHSGKLFPIKIKKSRIHVGRNAPNFFKFRIEKKDIPGRYYEK